MRRFDRLRIGEPQHPSCQVVAVAFVTFPTLQRRCVDHRVMPHLVEAIVKVHVTADRLHCIEALVRQNVDVVGTASLFPRRIGFPTCEGVLQGIDKPPHAVRVSWHLGGTLILDGLEGNR